MQAEILDYTNRIIDKYDLRSIQGKTCHTAQWDHSTDYTNRVADYWGDTPHAYCGSTVPGFPNFLLLMGPNTGTGHTSVIYFIESSVRYLVDAIDRASRGQWKSFEVREDVEREYNRWLQKKLKRTVWQVGGCKSWYLNKQGINTTLYPDFSFIFRYHTRKFQEKLHKIE